MSRIPHHTVKCRYVLQKDVKAEPDTHPEGGPVIINRNPTTSFLTATTLMYAIGAGTTAAANRLSPPKLHCFGFPATGRDHLYLFDDFLNSMWIAGKGQ